VKMLTHLHMMVYTSGVGTFAKEKLLELNWINLEKREKDFSVCSELCDGPRIGILH
jgi:hypothetical protein